MPGVNPEIDAQKLAEELAPRIAEILSGNMRGAILLGDDAVLDPTEAAGALRKSPSTLEAWRATGIGPRSIKTGPRSVGYRVADLKAFVRDAERAFPAA